MKAILTAALALSLLNSSAMAQPNGPPAADRGANPQEKDKAKGKGKSSAKDARPVTATPAEKGAPPAKDAPPGRAAAPPPQLKVQPAQPPRPQQQQQVRPEQPRPQPQPQPKAQSPQKARPQPQARPQPAPRPQPQYQPPAPVRQYAPPAPPTRGYWARGERLPAPYLQYNQYQVSDYSQWGLRRPPSGQRWMRDDNNTFYLVIITTGVVSDVYYRNDRDQRWSQQHNRIYSYNDDIYYQECRTAPDPAGVILGALIGGLIGNAAGNRDNRGTTTTAGVILGGVVGAALTRNMDCNDRSYAYKTYYTGFNAGRPGARYQWQNPQNRHRGEFTVGRYYNDQDNFRCADFTQIIYINNRPQNARGTACRQPDGSWVIVK